MKKTHTTEPVYYQKPFVTALSAPIISLTNWAAWPIIGLKFAQESDSTTFEMIRGAGLLFMLVGTVSGMFFAFLANLRDEPERKIRNRLIFISSILLLFYYVGVSA